MERLCGTSPDETDLEGRVLRFLSDRGCKAVTGIRRMGREEFAAYVAETAEKNGFPICMLQLWEGLESEAERILDADPDADIIFGQDLCHQVPAAVRYRIRSKDTEQSSDSAIK